MIPGSAAEHPDEYWDKIIEINLSELESLLNGPFTPDRATPVSKMKGEAEQNAWPLQVELGLIGSCTNSSYEDMARAASLARQAKELLVDDLLLIQAESGEVALVEANPKEPRELGRFAAIKGKTWNNPVLINDHLLVRNDHQAACYRLPLKVSRD